MHRAGVPKSALQLLLCSGKNFGQWVCRSPQIAGICFTGSQNTAEVIHRNVAQYLPVTAPFIAETGGINAMIIDSTALLQQAVLDVIASAFQSTGQRCSALRMLYVQQDIVDEFLAMLTAAMKKLKVGDPREIATDIGPLIDQKSTAHITEYVKQAELDGKLLFQLHCETTGNFFAPTVIAVNGIADIAEEIFGPVLHIAHYKSDQLLQVIKAINAKQFGLTFGIHSRIENHIDQVTDRLRVGNIYVNRNQIGAVVGTQPFGGENLSGTGPKAGGPHYVMSMTKTKHRAQQYHCNKIRS